MFALCALVAAALWAQTPPADEASWKQFIGWAEKASREPVDPFLRYRAKLIADGATEAAADARVALLRNLAKNHQDDMAALHFNTIYTATKDIFNEEPNAFLVAVAKDLRPGSALDVAMGQGRNALFLARKGWTVTGFDIAEDGLAVAQAQAARLGVKITTVKSNWENFDFGREKWDLIVFSYAWVPLTDAGLVKRIETSLKPGGLVLIEHPVEDPRAPQYPVDHVNALLKAYSGFHILRYEDVNDISDWRRTAADRATAKGRIVRLLARKRLSN